MLAALVWFDLYASRAPARQGNPGIIVIAATNRADVLDSALLRPGRFDRRIVVDLPDFAGRLAILGVHSRGKPLESDVDLAQARGDVSVDCVWGSVRAYEPALYHIRCVAATPQKVSQCSPEPLVV